MDMQIQNFEYWGNAPEKLSELHIFKQKNFDEIL